MSGLSAGSLARAAFFALVPAAGAGGGLALAPLLAASGLASFRLSSVRADLARPPLWLVLLGAFTAWLALSALWSPFGSAMQALKFSLTVGLGLVFARAAGKDARLTLAAGAAATIVLTALLAIEAAFQMPLNRAANPGLLDWQLAGNPGRGAAVLTSVIWACLGLVLAHGARTAALIALILAGVLASQFGQSANIVAFGMGAIAFLFGLAAPRAALIVISALLALWLLCSPFISPLLSIAAAGLTPPYSWAARLEIWRYVSARILEQPWIGHGLDASRVDNGVIIVQGQASGAIPLHPHSASLQIWFEAGAVGALLGTACLLTGGWALSRALRNDRPAAAAACGALAAIGMIANLSFGAWQEWWNATMLIAAALITALAARAYAPARQPSA
jgi:O-antigen ligase